MLFRNDTEVKNAPAPHKDETHLREVRNQIGVAEKRLKEIEAQNKDVEDKTNEIAELDKNIAEKKQQLGTIDNQITAQAAAAKGDVDSLLSQKGLLEKEIGLLSAIISDKQKEQEQTQGKIDSLNHERLTLENTIKTLKLTAKEEESRYLNEYSSNERKIAEQQAVLDGIEQSKQDALKEHKELAQQISAMHHEVKTINLAITDSKDHYEEAKAEYAKEISEKEAELKKISSEKVSVEKELASKKAELDKREGDISLREQRVIQREINLAELKVQVETLHGKSINI